MSAVTTIDDVLARLDRVHQSSPGQWDARCPHHPDKSNSLSVTIGANGLPVFHCHAGCDWRDIRTDLELGPMAGAPGPGRDKADAGRPPNAEELRQLEEYLAAASARLDTGSDAVLEAQAYIERRFGLSAEEAVELGLGFDGGATATTRPGYLKNLGGHGVHVIVPMPDPAGRPLALQARALAANAKVRWLSPIGKGDEGLVNWSRLAFFAMGSPDPVIVCEGMSDPLTAVGAGYAAVGVRGASLARGGVVVDELVAALTGRAVVIAPDVDFAGADFAKRIGEGLAAADIDVRVIEIPASHGDLTGWHEAVGHEDFLNELEAAVAVARPVERPSGDGGGGGEPPTGGDTGGGEEQGPAPGGFHMTDLGNARRLVKTFGRHLRFVPHWKSWLAWDGRRWRRDAIGEVHQYAKKVVAAIHVQSTELDDAKLKTFALRSEAERALRAMVVVASTEPTIPVEPGELDSDPWLLTVLNGTVDLRTGQLLEHDPSHLITKLAPVVYDPGAQLDMWDEFLRTTTDGDEELIAFLQRAAGYTLTGRTNEEKLFFAYGPTASGKSTFLEALAAAMGDYAMTAEFKTFLEQRHDAGAKSDIARLAGARFVKSIEVDEGKKLAEGLVKTLIGGDKVTARFLYANEFEYLPAFKLWLAANHSPKISFADEAMWRRILRVPFEHGLPAERRDPLVKSTLRDPRKAGPAILAWAVQGCLAWQRDGLGVPLAVEKATQAYREEQDVLKEFFDDECVVADAEAVWVTKDDLYAAYEEWAKKGGIRNPFSKRRLGDLMSEKGFDTAQTKRIGGRTTRIWKGIAVADTSVGAGALFGDDADTQDGDTRDDAEGAARDVVEPRDVAATQSNSTASRAGEAVTRGDEAEDEARDADTQLGQPLAPHARAGRGEVSQSAVTALSASRAPDEPRCVVCGAVEVWTECATCRVPLCRPHAGEHGLDHLREEQPELFDENGNLKEDRT